MDALPKDPSGLLFPLCNQNILYSVLPEAQGSGKACGASADDQDVEVLYFLFHKFCPHSFTLSENSAEAESGRQESTYPLTLPKNSGDPSLAYMISQGSSPASVSSICAMRIWQ